MAQIKTKFLTDLAVTKPKIAANAVDGSKIRLSNDEMLRARNNADDGDVDILKVNTADRIEFDTVPQSPSDAVDPNDLVRYSQLASITGSQVKVSSDDTTAGYVEDKFSVDVGSNATNALEATTQSPGGDETYRIRFDQSKVDHGSLAGLTDDDHPQYLKTDGSRTLTGNQSAGGFKVTNAANGTSAQDYVTKAQLDAVSAGLDPKGSVRAATTAALPAATYDNGTGGVGATLTGDLFAALPDQDDIVMQVGDRLLVKDQAAALQNGIYVVSDLGDGLAQGFILTRSTDQDGSPANEVSGGNFTFVEVGTTLAGSGWTVLWDGDVVVGTDPLNWSKFSSITFIGGDMINLVGNTISVDLLTNGGLKSSNPGNIAGELEISLEASNPSLEINGSNELKAKLDAAGAITSGASGLKVGVDSSTIEINTNALRVKDAGITLAKLASNSVDENKIAASSFNAAGAVTGGGGSKIAVQVDNSTIEINTNALRVKAAGITESHLNTSVAGAGLSGGGGTPLAVNVDASTIEINSDTLRVKDAGITLAKLASNSVDENKIVSTAISTTGGLNGGSGTKLSARVDASTVKINASNNLEGLKHREQKFTLSGTDITNQYVDLASAAHGADAANNSLALFAVGGPMQEKAVDYTVSLTGGSGGVTRVSFAGDLATGGNAALVAADILVISYDYLT